MQDNRWLAYTIKKIYALVQVQIHNTHIHIQRGCVSRYIKGERVCVWRGDFKMTKCCFSLVTKSLHGTIWQLFSFINATNITTKNLFCCYKLLAKKKTPSDRDTHILGFLPASIDPFTPRKTKEAPPDRKKRGRGIWPGLQPSKRAQPGFPNAPQPSPRLELTEARERRKRD